MTESLHAEIDAVDWNAFRSGAGEGGGDLLAEGLHLLVSATDPLPCHRSAALMLGYLGGGEPHWTENSSTRPMLTWLDRLRPRERTPPETGVRLKQDIQELLENNTRGFHTLLQHPDSAVRQFGIVMVGDYDHSAAGELTLNRMTETDIDQTVREVAALPPETRNLEAWRKRPARDFRGLEDVIN